MCTFEQRHSCVQRWKYFLRGGVHWNNFLNIHDTRVLLSLLRLVSVLNLYTSFYEYMQSKKTAKKIGPNLYCQIQCCIFIPSLHLGFSVAITEKEYQLKLLTIFILAIICNRNIIMFICQWSILETPSLLFKWNLCIHMIMPSCYIRVYNHMYAVMFLKGSYERKNINGM